MVLAALEMAGLESWLVQGTKSLRTKSGSEFSKPASSVILSKRKSYFRIQKMGMQHSIAMVKNSDGAVCNSMQPGQKQDSKPQMIRSKHVGYDQLLGWWRFQIVWPLESDEWVFRAWKQPPRFPVDMSASEQRQWVTMAGSTANILSHDCDR